MFGIGTLPDLLRLVVVPVLAWTAWRDVRTRRVPNVVWYPLAALGVVLLAWELLGHLPVETVFDRLYLVRVGVSVFFVVPLSYLFWRLGGFGGADAKALMVFAVLLPTFPAYTVAGVTLPLAAPTTLGVFSMTILTNTVIVGLAYPLLLAARNLAAGEFEFPLSFVGRRVAVSSLATAHGRLFESPEGITRNGLDLDALRMYLRWRGLTLADLRSNPDALRDPASIDETFDPTDGAVHRGPATDGGVDATVTADGVDGGVTAGSADAPESADHDDPWGAAAFLDAIDGSAYGTTPEKLRGGLELVADRESVWISPGIPFIVPMFVGLVVALVYGDVLFGVLGAFGIV